MSIRLRNILEWLRTSYWVVPSAMLLAAAALAAGCVWLDEVVKTTPWEWWGWAVYNEPDGARDLLSTIAGSMITVAGVVFSITIVALSLASTQFGPRLLNNFIRDSSNQFALGTFTATFLYCLLVLRAIRGGETADQFVPHIAVTVGLGLAIASLCVLIYFIHHVAASIRASNVISLVGEDLRDAIARNYPNLLDPDDTDDGEEEDGLPEDFGENAGSIVAAHQGYLQAVDHAGLASLAEKHDIVLRSRVKPGDFVVEGVPLAQYQPAEDLPEEVANSINDMFIVGRHRTAEQDIRLHFNRLAEVAIRALSPGVNDPYTAMTCIDWLGASLCELARREMPSPRWHDDDGNLRLVIEPVAFYEVLEAAYSQIRHYGRDNRVVVRQLLDSLTLIAARVVRDRDREALESEARALKREALDQLRKQDDEEDDIAAEHRALMKRLTKRDKPS